MTHQGCYFLRLPERGVHALTSYVMEDSDLFLLVREQCGLARGAALVWTHGLEWGEFADLKNESYMKDLPLAKATLMSSYLPVV